MTAKKTGAFVGARTIATSLAVLVACGAAGSRIARGDDDDHRGFQPLVPGNLLVSRSVYDNKASTVTPGVTVLPAGCTSSCTTAIADGQYPGVFNNDTVDGSFGITSKILLDQLTPNGHLVGTIEVPNSSQRDVRTNSDQMVTSFSSKSELALNLSTDGQAVTFMGYLAPVDAIDISNSNTPADPDPTNPVNQTAYRVVAELDQSGHFRFTKTNAYSGNNGRAAIEHANNHERLIYTAGNAGNGSDPQPNGIIIGAGAQIMTAADRALVAQSPGDPTPVGSFSITQLGKSPDKVGKDTNFRGLTIFNDVVYLTKGSGSNGINTVYFIDNSGFNSSGAPAACPSGSGVPAASATLPASPIAYDASQLQTKGVVPYNMCILNGLPIATKSKTAFPFGVWFANANTLYVADEGNGTNTFASGTYTAAAAQTQAGLQKWTFDGTKWSLAYVLQAGLNLGVPYTVPGYPTDTNTTTGLPWLPATDGLRNITGRVNNDGTVTIWAVTSTVSGSGDQGADPNKLVMITDALSASSRPATESFVTVKSAGFAEVLRGVSFTPGTDVRCMPGRFGDDDRCDHH
jgi:hypothetical protein